MKMRADFFTVAAERRRRYHGDTMRTNVRSRFLYHGAFLLTLLLAVPGFARQEHNPFVIELAPGVFMRDLDGIYGSNQVFIIFDTFVAVFDASPVVQARLLLKEIRDRTDKPVRYVINSHFHPDHAAGTAVFAAVGAEVVGGAVARYDYEFWARDDFATKAKNEPEVYRGLVYAPPTRYLDGPWPWVLEEGSQRLEVHHFGHGHTTGDLVGWMPNQRIMFAGDLSTNGRHTLGSANLSNWISILEKMMALQPVKVVPGHRQMIGPEILSKSHRYLFELRSQVRDMVAKGMTYDQVKSSIDIPFYTEWTGGTSVRDEPSHTALAYVEAGGVISRPLITIRGAAIVLGIAVLAAALIAVNRNRKIRHTSI